MIWWKFKRPHQQGVTELQVAPIISLKSTHTFPISNLEVTVSKACDQDILGYFDFGGVSGVVTKHNGRDCDEPATEETYQMTNSVASAPIVNQVFLGDTSDEPADWLEESDAPTLSRLDIMPLREIEDISTRRPDFDYRLTAQVACNQSVIGTLAVLHKNTAFFGVVGQSLQQACQAEPTLETYPVSITAPGVLRGMQFIGSSQETVRVR